MAQDNLDGLSQGFAFNSYHSYLILLPYSLRSLPHFCLPTCPPRCPVPWLPSCLVFCGGGVALLPCRCPSRGWCGHVVLLICPLLTVILCWLSTGLASRVLHFVDVVVVVKRIVLCFPDCSDLPSLYGASQLPWGSGSSSGGSQECRW